MHLARLKESASKLGWVVPEDQDIVPQIYQSILGKAHLTLRLRLTMSRHGVVAIQVTETTAQRNLLGPFSSGTAISQNASLTTSNQDDDARWTLVLDTQSTATTSLLPLIENKTTSRNHYTDPMIRTNASIANREEVLLYNEQGQVTEGTITNVLFLRDAKWVTPAVDSGLLNGLMRRHLLKLGKIEERVVLVDELVDGEHLLICNAVRGVFPAILRLA